MKKKYTQLALLCGLLLFFAAIAQTPVSAQPGSSDDPLVSKKYVDDQVAALKTLISQNMPVITETPSTGVTTDTRDMLVAEA